ncbi:MAG: helix-turn-helix transcriptional regulator [Cytophagales bacterium]|nr:helix-turn-helix transcriptional regulator [Cytophagales bacterium]
MDKLATIFGNILREERKQKGMSQEKLANLCDLDRSYISRIERGIISPTVKSLFVICAALEVEPADFVSKISVQL